MTYAQIVSWQQAAIVALVVTNGLSLAVALVAVSVLRLAMSDLPPWATKILDRLAS